MRLLHCEPLLGLFLAVLLLIGPCDSQSAHAIHNDRELIRGSCSREKTCGRFLLVFRQYSVYRMPEGAPENCEDACTASVDRYVRDGFNCGTCEEALDELETNAPVGQPSPEPTADPRNDSSMAPSREPSEQPTIKPSLEPSHQPSTDRPSSQPSDEPQNDLSMEPSREPSEEPTTKPSLEPSYHPSTEPTNEPSNPPSGASEFPFETGTVLNIYAPTTVAVGPDGKLYVGTMAGLVYKLTLDEEDYSISSQVVSNAIATSAPDDYRVILGLAFDPTDTGEPPVVYVSHSTMYHESTASFAGASINGKVSTLSGANLDVLNDVVTGLPVSNYYHGVNGIMFDNDGNLFIQVGGSTNAGVPSNMSDFQLDNVLGAATLRANVSHLNFNGTLEYDEDGNLMSGTGVEVFASGERNSLNILLHSNGKLYATDSGAKSSLGDESTSCNTAGGDPSEPDQLNLVQKGSFYGHANRAREECVWRSATEASDSSYTAPLQLLPSDTSGLIEFDASHFDEELRGNLVLSQYGGSLYRVILDESGESVVSGPVMLLAKGGLDLVQGPDGTIFVAQLSQNAVVYHRPMESTSSSLTIKSVFPRRGSVSGGNKLTIYGENLVGNSDTVVSVGAESCAVQSSTSSKIECTIPPGLGLADIRVAVDNVAAVYENGYRYVGVGDFFETIRVSAGETNASFIYFDTTGNAWTADNYYNETGEVFSTHLNILRTEDDVLFQTERYGPDMAYSIPVEAAWYEVTLYFCEIYWSEPGQRNFNVSLEGLVVLENFDIIGTTGRNRRVHIRTFEVLVDDGILNIDFAANADEPQLSALQIVQTAEVPSASEAPSYIPSSSPSTQPTVFGHREIFISAGELEENFTDTTGELWVTDRYYNDVGTFEGYNKKFVRRTEDDELYKSWREGPYIHYSVPVLPGDYVVTLHFSEGYYEYEGLREFDILLEGKGILYGFDPYRDIGWDRRAYSFSRVATEVMDGFLDIEFVAKVGNAIINAIEIETNGPHLAHSVPGGPYTAVDTDGDGSELVPVNAFLSHTHAPDQVLVVWRWMLDGVEIASGEQTNLPLPVGQHIVNLKVIDSGENESDEFTEVSVLPKGYPSLDFLSPSSGDWEGGETLTLVGTGFNYTADDIVVKVGSTELTGPSKLAVVNDTTIIVTGTPSVPIAAPYEVTVTTPIGTSNVRFYTYIAGVPIAFEEGSVVNVTGPACVAYGPDGKLYVGTGGGSVYKLTLDDDYNVLESVVSNKVAASVPDNMFRVILGIAFDPFDTSENPTVYVSHSSPFHGSNATFTGLSINGKVSTLSGANLDVLTDVVTGLPVSDHDHVVNGIMFDDSGDLYIQVGGNTNAGVPGALTQNGIQKENVLGAATVLARLSDPNFNGTIVYDANGELEPGSVEIFATGQRNSYDLVLHSNGNIYATDNGPNTGYGEQSTSCTTSTSDPSEPDKLNLLVQGGFYGHANRARNECVWRSAFEPSDGSYTAPLAYLSSSTDGIIEFESSHFGGQLRGNLIASQFSGAIYRVVLDESGQSVLHGPSTLVLNGGLDLIQGPDGTLFVAQYSKNSVIFHRPIEPPAETLTVKSVFPRRGHVDGGSKLTVFGHLFSEECTVTVGGLPCPVVSVSESKIECTLPVGSGAADVVVASGSATSTFEKGYRYIGEPRWETLTTDGGPRKRHEACLVMASNGKAYMIGGRGDKFTTEYDPVNQKWVKTGSGKAPILLHHMQCVAADDRIWIVSAWTGFFPNETNVEDIYIYDPVNDSWETKPGLPEARRRGGAAAVYVERNGTREIYVSHGNRGGHGSHAQSLGWLDKYDIDSNTWTTELPDAPHPRDHTGGALVNNSMICVAAGRDGGDDDFFNTLVFPTDCYNLDTGMWETKADIPVGRAGSAYGTTCDGKLIVAGGEGLGQAWPNVDVFDGENWTALDDLRTARHGTGLAVSCDCNEIFISSGSGDQGGSAELASTERYRPIGSTCFP